MMSKNKVTGLTVVEGKHPIGILTERDIMQVIVDHQKPGTLTVGDVMTSPVVSAPSHLDFFEAYHICVQKNIRHLIVVNELGELSGLASESDFLRALGMDVMTPSHLVKDSMKTSPLILSPNVIGIEAIRRMHLNSGRTVIIAANNEPVGILTDKDVLRLGVKQSNLDVPLNTIMTKPIVTVEASATIHHAVELMRDHNIRRLVVVNDTNHVVGLLTEHDIVKGIENQYVEFLTSVIDKQLNDINTARKQINDSSVLTSILRESLDIALIATDVDGNVRYLNPDAKELLNLNNSDITGKHISSLIRHSGIDNQHLVDGMEKASAGERHIYESLRDTEHAEQLIHGRVAAINNEHDEQLGYVHTLQDITEKRRIDTKLRQAASIFDNTVEAIMITDIDGNILSVNPAFTTITGYSHDEVFGKNPRVLSSGRHDKSFYQMMWHKIANHGYWQGEIWNRRKNGEVYAEWLTLNTVLDDDGLVKNYIAVFADITSLKKSQEDFEFKAHHDALTQLPNRLLLKSRMNHALIRGIRATQSITVMFIDLDGFKPINDKYGHQVGDVLLQQVAGRLLKQVRREDTVSRWGGDEFIILLEDITTEAVKELVNKLLSSISKPYVIEEHSISISTSIGIALSSDEMSSEELIQQADQALYRVKEAGRNSFQFYK